MGWKDRAIPAESGSDWRSRATPVDHPPTQKTIAEQFDLNSPSEVLGGKSSKEFVGGSDGGNLTQGLLDSLPAAGAMVGGAVGGAAGLPTIAGVPVAALGGASLGMGAGEALKDLGERHLLGKEKSQDESLKNIGRGLIEGPFYEMAGQIPGAALERLAETQAGQKLLAALSTARKANAPAIEAAAERLGTKATPGMLNDSEVVRRTENVLAQKPTLAGYLTRKVTDPVKQAISETTEGLLNGASSESPFMSGEKAKEQIANAVDKKFQEPKRLFDDLQQYTKDIPSTQKSTEAVSRNILNIPDVAVFKSGPASTIAKEVTEALGQNPTADQIKTLKTMVGKKAAALEKQGQDSSGVWSIYARLSRLQENTIKRGVLTAARTQGEGNTIAQGMLGQLKSANQGWASGLQDLQNFSAANKFGEVKSPDLFLNKLSSVPSENLQESLLPLDNVRRAEELQKLSPEAFDSLRGARLRDLVQSSSNADKSVMPNKFLQQTKNLSPEAEKMLFREEAPKLDDLRLLHSNLPERTGPSGTPQGHSYFGWDSFNPVANARDLLQYAHYKAAANNVGGKLAESLGKSPILSQMAEKNPSAFRALVTDISSRLGTRSEGSLPAAKAAENDNGSGSVVHYDPGSETAIPHDEAKQQFLEGN
jgi:hypothetical protein